MKDLVSYPPHESCIPRRPLECRSCVSLCTQKPQFGLFSLASAKHHIFILQQMIFFLLLLPLLSAKTLIFTKLNASRTSNLQSELFNKIPWNINLCVAVSIGGVNLLTNNLQICDHVNL
jgi:hypothetical protein